MCSSRVYTIRKIALASEFIGQVDARVGRNTNAGDFLDWRRVKVLHRLPGITAGDQHIDSDIEAVIQEGTYYRCAKLPYGNADTLGIQIRRASCAQRFSADKLKLTTRLELQWQALRVC